MTRFRASRLVAALAVAGCSGANPQSSQPTAVATVTAPAEPPSLRTAEAPPPPDVPPPPPVVSVAQLEAPEPPPVMPPDWPTEGVNYGTIVSTGHTANSTSGATPSPHPALVGRPAKPKGGAWVCPFPAEADAAKIDEAVAVVVVTVDTAGKPTKVMIVSDPGHGFGRAARECAFKQPFLYAVDVRGQPIIAATPPIKVRFQR